MNNYYNTHPDYREKQLRRQKELKKCNCGSIVMNCNLKYHLKTKKHNYNLNKKISDEPVKICKVDKSNLPFTLRIEMPLFR